MTCGRCGFENERDARFCSRCGAPRSEEAPESEAGPVIATLIPDRLRIAAGDDAQLTVRIRNLTEVVERYDLRIDGVASAWAGIEPSEIRLLPDEEGEAAVTIRPPRSYAAPSGEVSLELRVDARAEPGWTVARAAVEVGAFEDLRPRLEPEHASARRQSRHRLIVENHGNADVEAGLSAVDPEQALTFFLPASIMVAPGKAQVVDVSVRARKRHLWGRPLERPFTVALALPDGTSVTQTGALSQRPLIPLWVTILVIALALIIVFANVLGDAVR